MVEYSHRNSTTKIHYATSAAEFKENQSNLHVILQTGEKILPETTNVQQSRLLGPDK